MRLPRIWSVDDDLEDAYLLTQSIPESLSFILSHQQNDIFNNDDARAFLEMTIGGFIQLGWLIEKLKLHNEPELAGFFEAKEKAVYDLTLLYVRQGNALAEAAFINLIVLIDDIFRPAKAVIERLYSQLQAMRARQERQARARQAKSIAAE